jgi:drug/metabolite transporter (DMT)-like permease
MFETGLARLSVVDRARDLSPHATGLLLTILGVLVLSPDSLLIRVIDADAWTIIFWRALLMSLALAGGIALTGPRNSAAQFRSIGRSGLVVAALFAAQITLFVTAISRTSVANTVVIFATAPLWAAVLSRIFLNERPPARVWAAATISFGAVAFIFVGSIGTGRVEGDLAAAGASLALAAGLTIIRRHREVSMVPAWAVGAFLASLASVGFAEPFDVDRSDVGVLLLSGFVVLPLAFALIAIGPRRLSAPETGLIMLLETALAPLWVWWALEDEPNAEALVGGAIIVGVLAINSVVGLRNSS